MTPADALPLAPLDEGDAFATTATPPASSAAPAGQPPAASAAPSPGAPTTPQDPWAQRDQQEKMQDLWLAREAAEGGPRYAWLAGGQSLDEQLAGDATRMHFSNVARAFVQGWDGGGIVPPDKWTLGPESEAQLKSLLTYSDVQKAQQTEWQAFNNALIYPAVRNVARAAALAANVQMHIAEKPLQAFQGLFSAFGAGVQEVATPILGQQGGRDVAALATEFLPMHTTGMPHVPEAPVPEGFRPPVAPAFERPGPGEVTGPEGRPVPAPAIQPAPLTPDIFTAAREEGVIGTQAEWDGSEVYNTTTREPPPLDVHGIARQIDPETMEQYDRLRSVHDLALQEFRDETERARAEVEASPAAHGERLSEIGAELNDLENVPNDRYVYRRRNQLLREQEQLRGERDEYLANAPDLSEMVLRSPENLQLRNFIADNAARMGEIEGRVRDVYAEAARRAGQVEAPPEEAAPAAPPAEAPAAEATPPAQPEAAPGEAAQPGQPSEPARPALDIATHAADQFKAAGRPEQEAADLGALAEAYYKAKAARFQGAKGTAEDLYRAEFPAVVGRAQGPRGASGMLQRGGGRSILTLFAKADPSTAIHELGHNWTLDLLRDAKDPEAPAQVTQDAATVRSWLNVPQDGDLTVRQQERMARGFETYMRTSTAPSARLAGVFDRFRDWINTVYSNLRNRGVPINDDIKGVFDRWFAGEGEQRPVVAEEQAGPPRKPRTVSEIMAEDRVRESVARQTNANELIAYSDWQAANRNGGTNATPAPEVKPEPGARPRTPRSLAQIMAEDKVAPAEAGRRQANEFQALADWQDAQRAAGQPSAAGREPPPGSVPPEEAQRLAREMLAPKEEPPAEATSAVPPEQAAEVAPEPIVAKNFGPEAKPKPPPPDRSRPYMRVPKEPQRLLEFMKDGVVNENGVRLFGRVKDPGGDLAAALGDRSLIRKIIDNQNGEPLDDFARRAADAGYFDGKEPETDSGVIDRIVADVEGHAQYSMHDQERVDAYQTAAAHNKEVRRLSYEHDIDPRGMTRRGFFQAIEDKVGKEQFDAQEAMERARAIDAANELRDDLQDWQGNEDEHAGALDELERERLWREATASQELDHGLAGGEQPGVSGGHAGESQEGQGHGGGGAEHAGPAAVPTAGGTTTGAEPGAVPTVQPGSASADTGAIPTRAAAEQQRPESGAEPGGGAGATAAGDHTPPAFPVARPTQAFEAADRARFPDPPKIGNIRLEYIPEGKYDQLVQDVITQMQQDGTFGKGATQGRLQARAEQAIFEEALRQWGDVKDKFQAEPTVENAIAEEQARGIAAAASASRSQETGFAGGYLAERGNIIKESKRRIAEMQTQGLTDNITLLQRQLDNALHGILNNSEQVGHALVRDYGFKDRVKNGILPYWMANILSNPETHGGYGIGGFLTNLWEGMAAIPAEAAMGAIREARGEVPAGGRVQFGEMPAYMFGLWNGYARALVPTVRVGNLLQDIMSGPLMHTLRTGEVAYPGLQLTGTQVQLAEEAAKRARPGELPKYAMSDGQLVMPYQQKVMTRLLGGWPGYLQETSMRVIRGIHLVNYTSRFFAEVSRMAYRAAQVGEPDALTMGVRMQNYFNNISEADIGYAHKVAIDSTLGGELHSDSTSTKVVRAIQGFQVGGLPVGRVIAPFPNVGIKMLQQWGQYTPLGLAMKDVRANLAEGGARADTAYGRMAAGSALAMGVAGLAYGGVITGPGPNLATEEGRAEAYRLKQSGWKPMSIQFGSVSIPYMKLFGPIGRLMGAAATLGVAARAGLQGDLGHASKLLAEGFKEVIFDDSWMRSIHDVADAATNQQELGYYAYNMASGLVPWSAAQRETARLVDPYERQASGILERLMQQTPFLSESLTPKIGWNGEPYPQATSMGPTWRNDDPVQQRMDALGMGQADFPHNLKGVPMTEEQREAYARAAGTTAHRLLLPLVTAPGFADLPRGVQMMQIAKTVKRSRHMAELFIQAHNPDVVAQQRDRKRTLRIEGAPRTGAEAYLPEEEGAAADQ